MTENQLQAMEQTRTRKKLLPAFWGLILLAVLALGLLALPGDQGLKAAKPGGLIILALGDSLTAGYGLHPSQAFPAVLETRLKERGIRARIVNAGVSGDTSTGGRLRLERYLALKPDAAIVELGINDLFRRMPPKTTEENLEAILARLDQAKIPVLLAGMELPKGRGWKASKGFRELFPRLARRHNAVYYPFFLAGVAGRRDTNLPDGLHPNPRGVRKIVDRIMPKVIELLQRVEQTKPAARP